MLVIITASITLNIHLNFVMHSSHAYRTAVWLLMKPGAGIAIDNGVPAMDIMLFPNPNNGMFNIKGITAIANQKIAVEVTDMHGNIVYKNNFAAVNGELETQLTLDGSLANGMYILNVRTKDNSKHCRLAFSDKGKL